MPYCFAQSKLLDKAMHKIASTSGKKLALGRMKMALGQNEYIVSFHSKTFRRTPFFLEDFDEGVDTRGGWDARDRADHPHGGMTTRSSLAGRMTNSCSITGTNAFQRVTP